MATIKTYSRTHTHTLRRAASAVECVWTRKDIRKQGEIVDLMRFWNKCDLSKNVFRYGILPVDAAVVGHPTVRVALCRLLVLSVRVSTRWGT